VTGTDGNLYASVQSTPSGPLGAPVTLGGTILAGSPSIGMFSDGRMYAFVNDAQGNTHTSSQQAPGSGWTAWAQI
jgi:hypothetical protein